jgi:hypothetical protein
MVRATNEPMVNDASDFVGLLSQLEENNFLQLFQRLV